MVVVTKRETRFAQAKSLVKDNGLPPSPRAAGSVLAAMRAREPAYRRIGELIAGDAALAAAILGAANSETDDPTKHVTTVRDAYTTLGAKDAAVLIEELVSRGAFPYSDHPRLLSCWQTSAVVANLARQLAQRLGIVNADVAETFALFRDCGIVALLPCLNAYDSAMQEATQTSALPLVAIEDTRFAINHARVGALLAQGWRLSPSMVEAIRDHHDFSREAASLDARDPQARKLIAIGVLAEEIDARRRAAVSCRDWAEGERFVLDELDLAAANIADLAATLLER